MITEISAFVLLPHHQSLLPKIESIGENRFSNTNSFTHKQAEMGVIFALTL